MRNIHNDVKYARQAIRKIAEREGISEEQVVADMERAMEEMRRNAYASGDGRKIAFWESLPKEEERATAYEFVEFLSTLTQGIKENQSPVI